MTLYGVYLHTKQNIYCEPDEFNSQSKQRKIAQTRIIRKDFHQGIGYSAGILQRERFRIRQLQQISNTTYVGI